LRVRTELAIEAGDENGIRARIIPGGFGDVCDSGCRRDRRVGSARARIGIPERAEIVEVAKIRAADGDVEWRRSDSVHREAELSRLRRRTAHLLDIATGRAVVSRGDQHGNSLGRGLAPERVVHGVSGRAEVEFTISKALAHNRGETGARIGIRGIRKVDDILRGEIATKCHALRFRSHQVDGRTLGDGARPLHVEDGLDLVAFWLQTRVAAAGWDDNRGDVRRQAKGAPEIRDILQVDVAIAHNRNGYAGAVNTVVVPERKDVVDRGKVGGTQPIAIRRRQYVASFGATGKRKTRLHSASGFRPGSKLYAMHRLRKKIVERPYAGDNGCERGGDRWVGRVGPVLLAVDDVTVDRRLKGFFHFTGRARKLNDLAAVRHVVYQKTVRCKPRRNLLNVLVGGAEQLAELRGREPFVVIGRGLVLLPGQQRLEGGLLRGAALQNQHHAIQRHARRRRAVVVLGAGERMRIAAQDSPLGIVYLLRDARLDVGRLRGGAPGAEKENPAHNRGKDCEHRS